MSKEAKLAKQDVDEVTDRRTDRQMDMSQKSLPNNDQQVPILVVYHCMGISAQLRCAEDQHSVSVRVITLTFIYEVTKKVSAMLRMKIFIPLVRPYLPPLSDDP